MIARFSCYPVVMWDSGIDISEYRSNSWCDWLADWFNQNDPYNHPVDSRSGGGSGGKHATNGSYYSDGEGDIIRYSDMINFWNNRSVPTAFTDIWCIPGHGGTREEMRRALWELGLVGGTAAAVGPNYTMTRSLPYASRFPLGPDVGHASNFFRDKIVDLGKLDPHDDLIKSGNLILAADPSQEYIGYLNNGGSCSIDLSAISGNATLKYYDPKTGKLSNGTVISPSANTNIPAPSFSGDGVIWIVAQGSGTTGLGFKNHGKDGTISGDVSIQVYPNPINSVTNIIIRSKKQEARGKLKIYNVNGKLVLEKDLICLPHASYSSFTWKGNGLRSGIFLASVKYGKKIYMKQLIMIK
jgi:hypothetical protein